MLAAVVDEAAARFGDAPALLAADGWALSYRQLAVAAEEVAAVLRRRGIGEGDVVALVLPSVPEHLVAYAAAAKVGAVTAGVNARLTAEERAAVLARADPRLVLATEDLLPGDTTVPGADRFVVTPAERADDVLRGLREPGATIDRLPDDPDRPVAIVFTSGTTGTPKGAVFCGRQLDFITLVDTGRRWGGGAAQLAGTSLAHLGPTTKFAGNLRRGGTQLLMARWRAADALDLIERHRVPGVGGIPTQVALMLRDPGFDTRDLSCVQAVVLGGAPATAALVAEARERFGAAVAIRYSCTEAGVGLGTAFGDPPEDAEVSVGRAHDGVALTIVAPGDPEARALPPGEVGEVCLRSPAVMAGYWHDPEATRAAFTPDGSVRTGDLGHVDEQGRLHLVGRAREMYVRGGYNVYPVEVEGVLATHPDVADVAVVPRPDEVMGEVGVAVVVAREGSAAPGLDDLRAFAAGRLAHHKLPEATVTAEALPLTPGEKLDRQALARLVAEDG